MKTLVKIFFVLVICSGISACYPLPPFLTVQNNSSDTIYWEFYPCEDTLGFTYMYKYTLFKGLYKIEPYGRDVTEFTRDDFGYMCNEFGRCHIAIFILKQLTLEKYGLDSIRANRIYDKRYIYDMEGLDKMNYIIIYPYDRK